MMKFAGVTFSDPSTVGMLRFEQRAIQKLGRNHWRVPVERRWVLGKPLQRRVAGIAAAAVVMQERERDLEGIKLLHSGLDPVLNGISRGEAWAHDVVDRRYGNGDGFCEELTRRFNREWEATVAAMDARAELWRRTEPLYAIIAYALRGIEGLLDLAPEPQELKVSDVATRLACTDRHVQRLAREGLIAARRHPDGTWRCQTDSVYDYLQLIYGRAR